MIPTAGYDFDEKNKNKKETSDIPADFFDNNTNKHYYY
jgi:hypothetical protein